MRKVDDGEKIKKNNVILVATKSLPAVYHPNDDARWNAARSCQKKN